MFDIKDYLEEQGIHYITSGKNVTAGWINIKCPFCEEYGDPDLSQHLGINPATGGFHCWRCKERGTLVKLVGHYEKSLNRAREIIGPYLPEGKKTPYGANKERKKTVSEIKMPAYFSSLSITAKNPLVKSFLKTRGFDPLETCQKHNLSYAGHLGNFKFRMIIPIFLQNKMVSFQGRDITGKSPSPYKALSDEKSSVSIKDTLYEIDEIIPGNTMIIVEGILDQWKMGSGSVATYGTMWTKEQVLLLQSKNPQKIFILFDNEPNALRCAKELAREIWFCETEVITLTNHNDPGECSQKEIKEIKEAIC